MKQLNELTGVVDTTERLTFTFNRKKYSGFKGDTIASALYREGVRVFSRSFKYHRPRGLMCLSGSCPNCMVNVDGTPNLRACVTPLEPGAQVTSQNAWPSPQTDLMGFFDHLGSFLPVGFYYKTFMRPKTMWPVYEMILRNVAGLGKLDPRPEGYQEIEYEKQYRHAEVTVVGGGPAGMSAALAAAGLGARVVLIDENLALGGHLRYHKGDRRPSISPIIPFVNGEASDFTGLARKLSQAVYASENIEVLLGASAFGWYEGNLLGVVQVDRLIKLRTDQLVVATGQMEQPLVFENNDLPGVFLGSGLQRLAHLYGVKPGERAVVVTNNDYGWHVAVDLLAIGVEVSMVAEARRQMPDCPAAAHVRASGVPVLAGYTILKAQGKSSVEAALLIELGEDGAPIPGEDTPTGEDTPGGSEVAVACNLIAVSMGFVPNNALLCQSGAQIAHDPSLDNFRVSSFPPAVLGAGHAVATDGVDSLVLEGRAAGLQAALRLERLDEGIKRQGSSQLIDSQRRLDRARSPKEHQLAFRTLASVPGKSRKKFVCYCEDATEKDLRDAIAEGFDDIETLKRYSTVSMGPCQGKMCSLNTIRVCAHETGRSIAETGRTTSRPPFVPVKLGVLAGRKLEPTRHTPMHHQHLALGAKMMDAGQWKRPEHYGDPHAEVLAVHEKVGVIDVSTLGKIEVFGPDSLPFLERIYTNRFANLKIGRIRYGVMCTEEGVIFDDGVVARLGEGHYYLTTTTSGIGGVYEWLTWWLATWRLQVHVENVTADYAAVNLAGVCARETLAKLTDLDLSSEAFPYLHLRQTDVAGVPTRLMRIGFVGEMGYEMHFPAPYGPYIWQALMQAGAEFGIRPFGVEAQRVLRLEKGHIIVGQDTDALSDPLGAGLDWTVKLDKPDFIGKAMLASRKKRGLREMLIRFEMINPGSVPGEGEQIVENGRFIGRVTSARQSPTLEKSIGMGWIPPEKAAPGTRLQVRVNGRQEDAVVVAAAFYDPDGKRLRA